MAIIECHVSIRQQNHLKNVTFHTTIALKIDCMVDVRRIDGRITETKTPSVISHEKEILTSVSIHLEILKKKLEF